MAKDRSTHQRRWWVVSQHQDVTVVEASERPTSEVAKGERLKRVRGPYSSQAEADKAKENINERTLRTQVGR